MDEGRRFLRYVSPGILVVLEAWLLVASFRPVSFLEQSYSLLANQGVGAAVSLIIVGGGLGYLLSMVHHVLHWSIWMKVGLAASPEPMVEAAIIRKDLGWSTTERNRNYQTSI